MPSAAPSTGFFSSTAKPDDFIEWYSVRWMLFRLAQPMERVVAAKSTRHSPSFFIAIILRE
jgi:hypothetical protein